jgi:hypothetical protein
MSILDTFNQLREEKQSLETLASLPQTLIMNMVQRKEIPQEDLPMIMAKKAEMAQTTANMKAAQAQQQQGQAGTIMEQLLAKNAAEEAARSQPAPQELTDVGIASNPVPEMRMAGGGIVAFSGTDGSYVSGKAWEDMTAEERAAAIEANPALARSRNVTQGVKNFFAPLAEGKNWDPIRKTHEIVNDVVMKPWQRFISEPANIQADKFRGDKPYSYEATPEDKAKAKEATILKQTKDRGLQTADQPGDYDMYDPKKVVRPAAANPNAPAANPNAPAAANPAKPSIQDEQRGIFDEYKKLYAEDKEAAAAARNEAKWQRIMEAGLNMMGGESPYAFANIGKGAATAARGYAEDVKGFRAEDRERKKQLAALGIKEKEMGLEGRKLDITEQRFKEMSDIERQKLNVLRQSNLDDKMAQQVEKNFATLMTEYRNSIDKGDMTISDLYRMAQENVASTRGLKTGVTAPAARVPGYDPATRTFK